jgi:hypothetical protein
MNKTMNKSAKELLLERQIDELKLYIAYCNFVHKHPHSVRIVCSKCGKPKIISEMYRKKGYGATSRVLLTQCKDCQEGITPVKYHDGTRCKYVHPEPIPTSFDIGDKVRLTKIPGQRGWITEHSKIGMHGVIVDYGPHGDSYIVYWSTADYEGRLYSDPERDRYSFPDRCDAWNNRCKERCQLVLVSADAIALINKK